MNSVLQQYYKYYDIVNSQQRMQHYQLSGSHLQSFTKIMAQTANFAGK